MHAHRAVVRLIVAIGSATRWAAVLVGHYFFMIVRHEAAHASVAVATGAAVLEIHLWPPRYNNLSWIVIAETHPRPPWMLWAQAIAPYLVSAGLIVTTLLVLTRKRPGPAFASRHVLLGGVIFPLIDLALGVGLYWVAANDLAFVFGPSGTGTRLVLSTWVLLLAAVATIVLRRTGGALAPSPRIARRAS